MTVTPFDYHHDIKKELLEETEFSAYNMIADKRRTMVIWNKYFLCQ